MAEKEPGEHLFQKAEGDRRVWPCSGGVGSFGSDIIELVSKTCTLEYNLTVSTTNPPQNQSYLLPQYPSCRTHTKVKTH